MIISRWTPKDTAFVKKFDEEAANLAGDPIARGLTCEEEDAEVGRLWGIDASRVEDGE